MQITEIKIRRIFTDEPHLRAIASIVIDDCLAIHDIKLIEGQKGFFLAMPNRQTPNGKYLDVAHPMDTETRALIFHEIYDAYISSITQEVAATNE